MKWLRKLLEFYTPSFVKRQALRELFTATAKAFGQETPRVERLSFEQQLRSYALFTNEQAEKALEHGDIKELQVRLHQNAYGLGQNFRKRLGIARVSDAMAWARLLYGIIGIDFAATARGEIVIKGCYFSQFYSPKVCQLISSLDEGLLAGLAGGGTLCFNERISEGADACKACFLQTRLTQEAKREGL